MARVKLSVHDADWPLYKRIAGPENGHNGVFWKELETESLSITFFRPDGPEPDDA